jgi:hypothetical protein
MTAAIYTMGVPTIIRHQKIDPYDYIHRHLHTQIDIPILAIALLRLAIIKEPLLTLHAPVIIPTSILPLLRPFDPDMALGRVPPGLDRKQEPDQRRHRPDQLQAIQVRGERQTKQYNADCHSDTQPIALSEVEQSRVGMDV